MQGRGHSDVVKHQSCQNVVLVFQGTNHAGDGSEVLVLQLPLSHHASTLGFQ